MLDRIKRLFIVEDDDPLKKALEKKAEMEAENTNTVPESETVPSVQKRQKPTTSNTPPPVAPRAAGGKVTEKFMNILLSAMDKNNVEGFDYLEFKQSLQNLQGMDMDEATKYQSAFAMAKTMGATPTNLLQTANHYLNVLKEEEAKFGQALNNQRDKQIGDRQNRIDQLQKVIAEKQRKIEQLTKEIDVHRQESDKITQEIQSSTVKVENTKNNFVVTYKLLVSQIQDDINKMKQYLG